MWWCGVWCVVVVVVVVCGGGGGVWWWCVVVVVVVVAPISRECNEREMQLSVAESAQGRDAF